MCSYLEIIKTAIRQKWIIFKMCTSGAVKYISVLKFDCCYQPRGFLVSFLWIVQQTLSKVLLIMCMLLHAGAASRSLSHSLPTVAYRLFQNTFGTNLPPSSSAFRYRCMPYNIVYTILFWYSASVSALLWMCWAMMLMMTTENCRCAAY